jgi:hypothetical protein
MEIMPLRWKSGRKSNEGMSAKKMTNSFQFYSIGWLVLVGLLYL